MAIAREPPDSVNHFRNILLFFSTDSYATIPIKKANKIIVRMVPAANDARYATVSHTVGKARDGNSANR